MPAAIGQQYAGSASSVCTLKEKVKVEASYFGGRVFVPAMLQDLSV